MSDAEARKLLASRRKISEFLFANKDRLDEIRNKVTTLPSSDWLLKLADNLTLTMRAPEGWVPGRPLHELGGHPPAPQFEQMRVGALAALADEFGHVSAGQTTAQVLKLASNTIIGETDDAAPMDVSQADETEINVDGDVVDDDGDDDDDDDDGDGDGDYDKSNAQHSVVSSAGDEAMLRSLREEKQAQDAQPLIQANKKSRQVNINFGGDSESDDDE